MVEIEVGTEINRPVEEVFAYVTDPAKVPESNSIVLEAKAEQPGPLVVGSRIHMVVRLLGRRIEHTAEVTEFEPNRKFAQKADFPFPGGITISVEPTAAGTRLTTRLVMEPGGFFKLAEPILGRILKKQFQAQADTLKELLEAESREDVYHRAAT
jgi:uncharacterized protein YndB with AHSA1/START domain